MYQGHIVDPLATYTDPALAEALSRLAFALDEWAGEGAAEEVCVHQQELAGAKVLMGLAAVLTACELVAKAPLRRSIAS